MNRIIPFLAILITMCAYARAANCVNGYYNGLPCATTTRYYDNEEGACGCSATQNGAPFSWYQQGYTAAASQAVYDPSGGEWCGPGCGKCFQLTPTGDCIYGTTCTPNKNPIVVMVTNLCPYQGNEQWCPNPGSTNQYGYSQHFDLQDYNMNGQLTALGWNNPVVTYKQVPCSNGSSLTPTCADAGQCVQCNTAPLLSACQSSSSSSSSSSSTSAHGATTTTSAHGATTTTSAHGATTTTSAHGATTTTSAHGTTGSSGTCSLSKTVANGSVTFVNNGSQVVKGAVISLSGGTLTFNNLVLVSGTTYNFPSWENALAVGGSFSPVGYSVAPTISVVSVSC